jgi:hypothetical protein
MCCYRHESLQAFQVRRFFPPNDTLYALSKDEEDPTSTLAAAIAAIPVTPRGRKAECLYSCGLRGNFEGDETDSARRKREYLQMNDKNSF